MSWWQLTYGSDPTAAIAGLLRSMVDSEHIDLVLVPQLAARGDYVILSLVADPEQLRRPGVVLPVMMMGTARAVADAHGRAGDRRIAAVLRSCEARALVELAKLQQVNLDGLTVIGVDCLGTVHPTAFLRMAEESPAASIAEAWIRALGSGSREAAGVGELRPACLTCVHPAVDSADVKLGFVGSEPGRLLIELTEELEWVADVAGLEPAGEDAPARRAELVQTASAENRERRRELLESGGPGSIPDLLTALAGCIRCLNCRRACPICYCRECTFETMLFEHEPDQYRKWADRKGAVRLPSDSALFHLTRMNHVGPSCVSCGLCELACPVNLPLTRLFVSSAADIQALFDYEPGSDRDSPLPYATFEHDELEPR